LGDSKGQQGVESGNTWSPPARTKTIAGFAGWFARSGLAAYCGGVLERKSTKWLLVNPKTNSATKKNRVASPITRGCRPLLTATQRPSWWNAFVATDQSAAQVRDLARSPPLGPHDDERHGRPDINQNPYRRADENHRKQRLLNPRNTASRSRVDPETRTTAYPANLQR
jgi:hypothetical protein